MPSVALGVLKAWRDALRYVDENPPSPLRTELEERVDELRLLYQRVSGGRPSPEVVTEAQQVIRETESLLRSHRERAGTTDGEWY